MTWTPTGGGILPHGEELRRAIRWIGESGDHSTQGIEAACQRFDLTPLEEEFLLRHFRDTIGDPPHPTGGGTP